MFNSLLARLIGGSCDDKTEIAYAGMQVGLRALTREDTQRHADHLLRLSPDDRRMRFFRPMNDRSVAAYRAGLDRSRTIVVGAFFGGVLHGVGELILSEDGAQAEIAVSVERDFRHLSVGRPLITALLVEARLRHPREVRLDFLRENDAMGRWRPDRVASDGERGGIPLVQVPMAPVKPPSSAPRPDRSFPS